jgi:hypothetical protein
LNKFGLALVVLALVAAPYSYALEIFSMDCNGGVRFLPSFPIGGQFDFSAALGVAETFLSVYKDRLKCMCSGLTDEEFNRLFHPFFGADMAFNVMEGPDADLRLSSCSWSAFNSTLMRANRFNYVKVNLTNTCNYASWKNDGKCLLQSQTFSDWDVTVKFGMFRCPNAPWRPAMSAICEGRGCDQAFIPCNSDSDCAGSMRCKDFVFNQVARPTTDDMLSAFRTILKSNDIPSSCINTGDIVRKTVDLVRQMWKKGSAPYTGDKLKVCSPIEFTSIGTNSTFEWRGLIKYEDYTSFISSSNYVSIPGYLRPWNGDLIEGGKMSAPQNVGARPSNESPLTPGATVVFKKTCDGKFTVVPTSGWGMTFGFGDIRGMIDHWVSTIMSVLRCRFNNSGVSISDQELKNRWGLGLEWLFFYLDSQTADVGVASSTPDFRVQFGSRINLPSSCNYDSWVKSGTCYATYEGLSNLLGVDVSANVEVRRCDSSSDVSVTVECVGAACSLLSGKTKPCNSNADCPNSLTCKDINPRLGSYDWVSAYVGVNTTRSPSCARGTDSIHAETRKLILSYLGMQYDGSSDNKYCMVDFDHVISQVSTWANGEVETTSPGVITLKNLKSWEAAGNAPTVSSGVSSTLSYLAVAFAVAMTIMFN